MLELSRIGDTYYATSDGAVIAFANLHESSSQGLIAEVSVTAEHTGAQHWSRLTLAAPRSRLELAKALYAACPGPVWEPILDGACAEVVRVHRAGVPGVALAGAPPLPAHWLLPGLVPIGETSVLFGDGGSLKSLFALALALAGLRGEPLADDPAWRVRTLEGPVLYLDWESHQAAHQGRLWGLCQGWGIGPTLSGVIYRPMERSLAESLPSIRREVDQHGVSLVVVDSLAPAAGLEPEGAEAATRTFNALRALPCTRLVLAHVSKAMADASAPARPFGSVFVQNLARATIEVRRDDALEPGDPVTVTYYHRKANDGPLVKPRALAWDFDPDGKISVQRTRADLARMGIPAQIIAQLRSGAKTVTDLTENLGISGDVARVTLNRLENRNKVLRLSDIGRGRGRKTLWGLVDTNRNSEGEQP